MSEQSAISWSIITVTYNSAEPLRASWGRPLPADVEWIVVDNASSDDSATAAEDLGATTVLRLDTNIGFGRANNEGFRIARGEYVVFANPDLAVDFTTLGEVARAIDRDPGLVAPQLLHPSGEPQPNGRGAPSLTNKVLSRLGLGFVRRFYYIVAEPTEDRYVAWCIGAVVAARADTFRSLGDEGPWDPKYFVYYEDADIALRAWQSGLSVRVIGSVRWVHLWARDTARMFRLSPWILEWRGMRVFYGTWPRFILGVGGKRWRGIRREYWGRIASARTATTEGES